MNPDKMRSSYGKLMYLLQDSMNPHVSVSAATAARIFSKTDLFLKSILNFDLDLPIRTVYRALKEINCLDILGDPALEMATSEIIADGESRDSVRQMIKKKEAAVKYLVKKYLPKGGSDSQEILFSCIYSISDYNAYIRCASYMEYTRI